MFINLHFLGEVLLKTISQSELRVFLNFVPLMLTFNHTLSLSLSLSDWLAAGCHTVWAAGERL